MPPPKADYGRPDRDIAPEIAQLESWRARRTDEPWRAHELATAFLYLVVVEPQAPDAGRLFFELVVACARDGASELEQAPATAALAERAWRAAPAAWRRWAAGHREEIVAAAKEAAEVTRGRREALRDSPRHFGPVARSVATLRAF